MIHDPDFNYGKFAAIKDHVGLNIFGIDVQEFAARTNAVSLKVVLRGTK